MTRLCPADRTLSIMIVIITITIVIIIITNTNTNTRQSGSLASPPPPPPPSSSYLKEAVECGEDDRHGEVVRVDEVQRLGHRDEHLEKPLDQIPLEDQRR
jgi:hypothetical protein